MLYILAMVKEQALMYLAAGPAFNAGRCSGLAVQLHNAVQEELWNSAVIGM